ncbi:MAG: zinc ribbon domain-containing protein [Caulobacteraceae bacterium]
MNLHALYELQGIQIQFDRVKEKLRELRENNELNKLKNEYQRLKEEYVKGEEKLKKNTVQQEIRSNELKNIQFSKASCEEIKFSKDTNTMKKLESIDKQIEKLDEKRSEVEKGVMKLVEEADNISKELIDTKKKLNFIKKKYLNLKENNDAQIEAANSENEKLKAVIEKMREGIDKESLGMFERLRRAHRDPVAAVQNRFCSGCKVEVPGMDYESLKNGETELRCQSCGRLLYFKK